jgi:two-component system sensor histidine kinase KdpD
VILLAIHSVSLSAIHLRLDHPRESKAAAKAGDLCSRRERDTVEEDSPHRPSIDEQPIASAYADSVPAARPHILRVDRPCLRLGLVVAVLAVTAATAAIYPLKAVAPAVSLSVVYLPAVLLISAYWGLALGLATSLASAAAFNFFHIPPVGRFTIADGRNWVALAAFMIVAAVVSTMAEVARNRELEAERGRAEADLAARLARELLAGAETRAALAETAQSVADALAISSVSIELGARTGDERNRAIPLRGAADEQLATLLIPRDLHTAALERLDRQVVPSLEALVAIALHRDAVQAEAVETVALRRSDELKTALLQAVSHDLRTPVTAVVAAGHAMGAQTISEEERSELSAAVVHEGERLSSLIDKLLDLSRLQAGKAAPRREWTSIEEVLLAARDTLAGGGGEIRLSVDADAPPLRADAVQLEQAFVNLLENARNYSDGLPVSVRARRVGSRLIVRIVDRGPGIPVAEHKRIFEPFYRGAQSARGRVGSGLGLAIAKGFVEANDGRISVESLPGQGTSFVVVFPLEDRASVPA